MWESCPPPKFWTPVAIHAGRVRHGHLPMDNLSPISVFAPHRSNPVWQNAVTWVVGANLAPGQRTVSAVARGMGLKDEHLTLLHVVTTVEMYGNLGSERPSS